MINIGKQIQTQQIKAGLTLEQLGSDTEIQELQEPELEQSINISIGKRLQNLRNKEGLTQKQLSIKTGLSLHSIIKYENDLREPNFEAIVKLAGYFRNDIDYLLGLSSIDTTEPQQTESTEETVIAGLVKSVDKISKLVAANNQLLKQIANRNNPLKRFALPIINFIRRWRNGKP